MFDFSKNRQTELQQLAKLLGEIVTGSQITNYFQSSGLLDTTGEKATKWVRIFNAFAQEINYKKTDTNIIKFIELISSPVNFNCDGDRYAEHKNKINAVLMYLGCELNDEGKVIKSQVMKTIDEVASRINNLQAELNKRKIHPKALKYCTREYLEKDYFHAVFEAIKGIFKYLRDLTNSEYDGQKLIEWVFSTKEPKIVINGMKTTTDIDEYEGFKNLLLFLHKSLRNVQAHELRNDKDIELDRALDIFVCISLVYKYLDNASVTCYINQ